MARRRMLLGNWKMFKTPSEAAALGKALAEAFKPGRKPDVVGVFPPALSFAAVRAASAGAVELGVQNIHWEREGAFTGELSAAMAVDAGATLVLVGHSERRQLFGETDETVNRRVKAALGAGLVPVVCVGETLAERDADDTRTVVERQLKGALAGLDANAVQRVVVAYEPVWAIGTGRTASGEQAEEVHAHIRLVLRQLHGALADALPILYGGSVKPDNAKGLMAQPNVDGALVGGASLDAASFAAIGDAF